MSTVDSGMRFLGFLVEAFKKSLWFSISGGAKLARVVEPGSCSNQWRAPIIAPLMGRWRCFSVAVISCCPTPRLKGAVQPSLLSPNTQVR
uniref:Uncharacterized protein n=1 Tax=Zea mays TaxID=4577 RepID=C0P9C3_MAIZE|nr:unknown [Zea mays]